MTEIAEGVVLENKQNKMKWKTKKEPEEVKSKYGVIRTKITWFGFGFQPLLPNPQTHPGTAK